MGGGLIPGKDGDKIRTYARLGAGVACKFESLSVWSSFFGRMAELYIPSASIQMYSAMTVF